MINIHVKTEHAQVHSYVSTTKQLQGLCLSTFKDLEVRNAIANTFHKTQLQKIPENATMGIQVMVVTLSYTKKNVLISNFLGARYFCFQKHFVYLCKTATDRFSLMQKNY